MIQRASLDDLEILLGLESACFSEPWAPPSLISALASDTYLAFVSRSSSAPRGYAIFSVQGQEGELLRLGVRQSARRLGLARNLLQEGATELKKRQVKELFLEVRTTNTAARTLYESEGFEPVGRRPGYYRDGTDALIYRRLLCREQLKPSDLQ